MSDQSGGYAIFSLAGPSARALLQRGVFIDLDPAVFATGSVATTVIARIGVTLWQVDALPIYHIAVFRSFVGSFRHWFDITSRAL